VKGEFASVRTEVKAEFTSFRTEVKGEFASLRAEAKGESAAVRLEIELVKRDLKIWLVTLLGGFFTVSTTIVLAALRYMLHTP